MIICKIGGGQLINIKGIISDLAKIDESFIIIHGANALRDQMAEKLGHPVKILTSVSGYSSVFSDEKALDIMMMIYAGLKNKRIVELCHQYGINAIGLSGLDGKLIQGKRNPGIRIRENGKVKMVHDFSGKPKSVNKDLLHLLIQNKYVPVICVPIIDDDNFAINTENDDIVNLLHETLGADKIIQLIEAPGLLLNRNNPNSLLKTVGVNELKKYEEREEGRIKRKLLALRKLFESMSPTIYISDGRVDHPIRDALSGKGTIIG
jgi:acetylglutamate/LysW-gamma-L-alpha-aminoadipate kinase